MDNIRITKIEDSEAITITEEEFDNKVKQCMLDLAKIQKEENNCDPFMALIYAMAYSALNRKLFKEDN